MKKVFMAMYYLLAGLSLRAQTWDEWFHQEATAKKYGREQLAALKVQSELVEKGYTIASQGLYAIQAIKKTNWEMHKLHFTSFSQVNPALEGWSLLQKIFQYQVKIVKNINKAQGLLTGSMELAAREKSYVQNILDKLHKETQNQQATLETLLRPGQLTLADDERFQLIESLYQSIQKTYAFLQSFIQETSLLILQRQREKSQTDQFRKNTGL